MSSMGRLGRVIGRAPEGAAAAAPRAARAPGRARRRPVRYAAVLAASSTLALSAVLVAPSASADLGDDKRRVEQQLQAQRQALDETSADLATAYQALEQTRSQLPAAQARLAIAQSEARAAQAQAAAVAARLEVAKANEARAVEQQHSTDATIDRTQRTLDAFAADVFQGGGGGSELSVALGATSPDDFATRIVLADTVTSMTNKALDDLANAKAEAGASQAYLTAVRAEMVVLKRQADEAAAAAQAKATAAQAAKAALDALAAQQASLAAEVASRQATERAHLAELEAEQARVQAALVEQARKAREEEARRAAAEAAAKAAAQSAGRSYTPPARDTNPTPGGGFLSRPMNGYQTSPFGWRSDPITGERRLHRGQDWAAECGTPVYAAAAGTVISVYFQSSYGNRIMIDHGIQRGVDLVTTYNHLARFAVSSGQQVARGQVIAYEGSTGRSTGCHLHFETIQDGEWVNPLIWF
jgi:murein DD-endopeptidase MepM/ murein hydrolase activator NlpD